MVKRQIIILSILCTPPLMAFDLTFEDFVDRVDYVQGSNAYRDPASVDGEEGEELLKIGRGELVIIDEYDANAKMFNLSIVAENAPGPNFVAVEYFVDSIIGEPRDKVLKSPKSLIGKKYVLQRDVMLLKGEEITNRIAEYEGEAEEQGVESGAGKAAVSDKEFMALEIKKDTEVLIQAYNAESKTFDLTMVKYPDQGPNFTTLNQLREAIPELHATLQEVTRNPASIKGKKFKLAKVLKLISDDELDERIKSFSKTATRKK